MQSRQNTPWLDQTRPHTAEGIQDTLAEVYVENITEGIDINFILEW